MSSNGTTRESRLRWPSSALDDGPATPKPCSAAVLGQPAAGDLSPTAVEAEFLVLVLPANCEEGWWAAGKADTRWLVRISLRLGLRNKRTVA
jgi:hypothetical protein